MLRQKQFKKARIHTLILILILLFAGWELRIIPFSVTHDFYKSTPDITGKKFWSWNEFRFEEMSVRGEGFLIDVYQLSDEMSTYFLNPETVFFENYPSTRFETSNWRKTPLAEEDKESFERYVREYVYGNQNERTTTKIKYYQSMAKEYMNAEGAYYAIGKNRGNEFFLIIPSQKKIIYIYNNE